jgi:hypothetical protein
MWWQGIMGAPRRVAELSMGPDDLARLEAIARSRSEPAARVERARILLAYHANPSSVAVGKRIGVMRHTVRRCVRRKRPPMAAYSGLRREPGLDYCVQCQGSRASILLMG